MKKLLFIPIVICFFCSQAQVKKLRKSQNNISKEALISLIQRDAVLSGITSLGIKYGHPNVLDTKSIAEYFNDSLKRSKTNLFYKKNSAIITDYLNSITSFGDANTGLYVQNNEFPFNYIDGNLTFIQSGIFSKTSLNTLQLNSDQRASYIVKSILLPSLSNFKPLLAIKEIKTFVIDAGYLAKDFSDDNSGEGELTSIVISRELLIKYINAEITDKDVFASATFYNVNKNMSGSVRKILVN